MSLYVSIFFQHKSGLNFVLENTEFVIFFYNMYDCFDDPNIQKY